MNDLMSPASHYGMATAGNNRKVHMIRQTLESHFVAMCGVMTPRRPQSTQETLPRCRRCYPGDYR